MQAKVVIERTSDGSDTLFVPEMNEHYHSIHGAKQESIHVFIEAGLAEVKDKKSISIFEVGFGTGLNTVLTFAYAEKYNLSINYHTVELHPISLETIQDMHFGDVGDDLIRIHRCSWNKTESLSNHFTITKINGDFSLQSEILLTQNFDLIYFDAFAPQKQPEMWTQEIFDNLYKHTNQDGILCTYCAKGSVRRMLQQSGYKVERIEGPPGKREMLRARKI